ncbi:MAG: hypothetical protein FWC86_03035, partial [Coriobacteriia bacterium]|nr:hypothetical protein [Coriobacteriia bacterium]
RLLGVGVSQFDEGAGQLCLFSDDVLQEENAFKGTDISSGADLKNKAMADTQSTSTSEASISAQKKNKQPASAAVSESQECLSKKLDAIKDKFGESSVLSGRQLKQSSEDKPWKARSITGGPKPEN